MRVFYNLLVIGSILTVNFCGLVYCNSTGNHGVVRVVAVHELPSPPPDSVVEYHTGIEKPITGPIKPNTSPRMPDSGTKRPKSGAKRFESRVKPAVFGARKPKVESTAHLFNRPFIVRIQPGLPLILRQQVRTLSQLNRMVQNASRLSKMQKFIEVKEEEPSKPDQKENLPKVPVQLSAPIPRSAEHYTKNEQFPPLTLKSVVKPRARSSEGKKDSPEFNGFPPLTIKSTSKDRKGSLDRQRVNQKSIETSVEFGDDAVPLIIDGRTGGPELVNYGITADAERERNWKLALGHKQMQPIAIQQSRNPFKNDLYVNRITPYPISLLVEKVDNQSSSKEVVEGGTVYQAKTTDTAVTEQDIITVQKYHNKPKEKEATAIENWPALSNNIVQGFRDGNTPYSDQLPNMFRQSTQDDDDDGNTPYSDQLPKMFRQSTLDDDTVLMADFGAHNETYLNYRGQWVQVKGGVEIKSKEHHNKETETDPREIYKKWLEGHKKKEEMSEEKYEKKEPKEIEVPEMCCEDGHWKIPDLTCCAIRCGPNISMKKRWNECTCCRRLARLMATGRLAQTLRKNAFGVRSGLKRKPKTKLVSKQKT